MDKKQPWFYWRDKALFIHVYLQPRASKDKIIGLHDDCLKISLTTPPVEGRANQHLLAFIAESFAVPKQRVTLVQGETGRKKWVKIMEPKDLQLLENN